MKTAARAATVAAFVTLGLGVAFGLFVGMYAFLGEWVLGIACVLIAFALWSLGCVMLGRKWGVVQTVEHKPYTGLPDIPMDWQGAMNYVATGDANTPPTRDQVDPLGEWEQEREEEHEDNYRRRMQGKNL